MNISQKLVDDLLDIIQNAVIVIDSQSRVIFANKKTVKMFEAEDHSLLGLSISDLFMPDDRDIMVPNILNLTSAHKEFEGEAMLLRRDGSCFLGLVSASAFNWDNEEGMAFTIHDITEMKTLEKALRQTERITFLGRMLNDISHQIRNPVAVIGGFARRLHADGVKPKQTNAIVGEAQYLEALLDTLNDFIKLPKPNPKHVSLNEIMGAAESSIKPLVLKRGCSWVTILPDDLKDETLLIDLNFLLIALEAVVFNACESYIKSDSENGVTFQLKATHDDDWPYAINIIDKGKGISSKDLPNIFHHFNTNKTKHIGMGLTFAQRIIEEQKGKIIVESSINEGTIVTFHLVKQRRRPIRTTRDI